MICTFNKIKFPKFIFVYFYIGEKVDISIYIGNLELFTKSILLSFTINNMKYKLVDTINVPTSNHYTCGIVNYNKNILIKELNGYYNYDGLLNPPILQRIKYNTIDMVGFIKHMLLIMLMF